MKTNVKNSIKKSWWIIVILFVLGIKYGFSQSQLEITKEPGEKGNIVNRVSKEAVVTVEGKTAEELYTKALEWIQVSYKNPEEVQKGQIQNEYVRFQGVTSNLICVSALGMVSCYDVRYTIELKFKDGRFKFEIIDFEQYLPVSKYSAGGWYPAYMAWNVTKAKGTKSEPNGIGNVKRIHSHFNYLLGSLETAMISEAVAVNVEKEDW